MEVNQVIIKLPDIQLALERYLSTKDHAELRAAYQMLTEARLGVGEELSKGKK